MPKVISYSSVSKGTVYWTGKEWSTDVGKAKLYTAKEVDEVKSKNTSLRIGTFVEDLPVHEFHNAKLKENKLRFRMPTEYPQMVKDLLEKDKPWYDMIYGQWKELKNEQTSKSKVTLDRS
jgi:hypothetical protein